MKVQDRNIIVCELVGVRDSFQFLVLNLYIWSFTPAVKLHSVVMCRSASSNVVGTWQTAAPADAAQPIEHVEQRHTHSDSSVVHSRALQHYQNQTWKMDLKIFRLRLCSS